MDNRKKEEFIKQFNQDIIRLKKYLLEKKHVHCLVCESFDESFDMKIIQIKNDEILIQSRLPKEAEIGNIITNEKYNPDEFMRRIEIKYCPFCSEELNSGFTFDDMIKDLTEELEDIENNI